MANQEDDDYVLNSTKSKDKGDTPPFACENSPLAEENKVETHTGKLCEEILITVKKLEDKLNQFLDKTQTEIAVYKTAINSTHKQLKNLSIRDDIPVEKESQEEEVMFNFPLKSIEDVFSFNSELIVNQRYFESLIKSYESIGGTGGNEEGKLVAKKLRTIFFTEAVLSLFSWTGISRTTGLSRKESFQKCDGILDLFLKIVSKADSRWCASKNENFFKYQTLKHAKQMEKAVAKKIEKSLLAKSNEKPKENVTNNNTNKQADEEPQQEEEVVVLSQELIADDFVQLDLMQDHNN